MTTLQINADWNIFKGRIKQKYGILTNNDLCFVEGRKQELFGRIQKRTGQTFEIIERIYGDHRWELDRDDSACEDDGPIERGTAKQARFVPSTANQ